MKTFLDIKGFLLLCTALYFGSQAIAGSAEMQKKDQSEVFDVPVQLAEVKDRQILDRLVSALKNEEGASYNVLKSSYLTKAYTGEVTCKGKKIYLICGSDIELPKDFVYTDDFVGFSGGSGGEEWHILLADADGNKGRVVSFETVLDLFGFDSKSNCPDIPVYLHGSEFHRDSGDSGIGHLRFKNGKYSILKIKKIAVEFDSLGNEIKKKK